MNDPGLPMTDIHSSTVERVREITVNGRTSRTAAPTLGDLIVEQGFGDGRVATAVNGEFVAERARGATELRDGDSVEILSIRQGG